MLVNSGRDGPRDMEQPSTPGPSALGETGPRPPATMDAKWEACALSDSTEIGRHRGDPLARPTEWKAIECLECFTRVDWGSGRPRRCSVSLTDPATSRYGSQRLPISVVIGTFGQDDQETREKWASKDGPRGGRELPV